MKEALVFVAKGNLIIRTTFLGYSCCDRRGETEWRLRERRLKEWTVKE